MRKKALDYNQKEFVASANPVMWVEKNLRTGVHSQ